MFIIPVFQVLQFNAQPQLYSSKHICELQLPFPHLIGCIMKSIKVTMTYKICSVSFKSFLEGQRENPSAS